MWRPQLQLGKILRLAHRCQACSHMLKFKEVRPNFPRGHGTAPQFRATAIRSRFRYPLPACWLSPRCRRTGRRRRRRGSALRHRAERHRVGGTALTHRPALPSGSRRTLGKIKSGRASSLPGFARSCLTDARTRSVSVGSRPPSHAWRSSDSEVTTPSATGSRWRTGGIAERGRCTTPTTAGSRA